MRIYTPVKCRGETCTEKIIWGTLFDKPHPFDFELDHDQRLVPANSHFDTCPDAQKYRGGYKTRLGRNAGIDQIRKTEWYDAYEKMRKPCITIEWDKIELIQPIPIHIVTRVTKLLTQCGGPLEIWHPKSLATHFRHDVRLNGESVAMTCKGAIFNQIHYHLYGQNHPYDDTTSVFSDMEGRYPVSIAGTQIEPIPAIPESLL